MAAIFHRLASRVVDRISAGTSTRISENYQMSKKKKSKITKLRTFCLDNSWEFSQSSLLLLSAPPIAVEVNAGLPPVTQGCTLSSFGLPDATQG